MSQITIIMSLYKFHNFWHILKEKDTTLSQVPEFSYTHA